MIEIPDRNIVEDDADETAAYPDISTFDGRTVSYAIGVSANPGTPYVPSPTMQPEPELNWWETEVAMNGGEYTQERSDTVTLATKLIREAGGPGGLTITSNDGNVGSPWQRAHAKQFDVDYISGLSKQNRTYTGADIVPTITIPGRPPVIFGDITTLSVSTHIEKFPVRTCGRRNPLGFSTGQRTVAGSMIFSLVDVYPWYKMMNAAGGEAFWDQAAEFPLADSLPPFDITITLHNEYEPHGAVMRLFGVTIVDDGMVFSIDDLITENTYSFMALGMAPVHRSAKWELKK